MPVLRYDAQTGWETLWKCDRQELLVLWLVETLRFRRKHPCCAPIHKQREPVWECNSTRHPMQCLSPNPKALWEIHQTSDSCVVSVTADLWMSRNAPLIPNAYIRSGSGKHCATSQRTTAKESSWCVHFTSIKSDRYPYWTEQCK